MLEPGASSIAVLMLSTNPNLDYIIPVFYHLLSRFPQCMHNSTYFVFLMITDDGATQELLCPRCVGEWIYPQNELHRARKKVGIINPPLTVNHKLILRFYLFIQFCTELHEVHMNAQTTATKKCWTHFQLQHDFFLSYRVITEGAQTRHTKVQIFYRFIKTEFPFRSRKEA